MGCCWVERVEEQITKTKVIGRFLSTFAPVQNESRCTAVHMEMRLIWRDNKRASKTYFHMKGCAPGLVLKQRQKATRKWPIGESMVYARENKSHPRLVVSCTHVSRFKPFLSFFCSSKNIPLSQRDGRCFDMYVCMYAHVFYSNQIGATIDQPPQDY